MTSTSTSKLASITVPMTLNPGCQKTLYSSMRIKLKLFNWIIALDQYHFPHIKAQNNSSVKPHEKEVIFDSALKFDKRIHQAVKVSYRQLHKISNWSVLLTLRIYKYFVINIHSDFPVVVEIQLLQLNLAIGCLRLLVMQIVSEPFKRVVSIPVDHFFYRNVGSWRCSTVPGSK